MGWKRMEFFTTVLSHFTEKLTNLIFNQDARDPKGLGCCRTVIFTLNPQLDLRCDLLTHRDKRQRFARGKELGARRWSGGTRLRLRYLRLHRNDRAQRNGPQSASDRLRARSVFLCRLVYLQVHLRHLVVLVVHLVAATRVCLFMCGTCAKSRLHENIAKKLKLASVLLAL